MALSLALLSVLVCAASGKLLSADYVSPLGPPPSIFQQAPVPPTIPNCPYHPATVDLPDPIPDELKTVINQRVELLQESILNKDNLPGIALGFTYKGKVLYSGGLGVKNKSTSATPDANTIFRIGSVSKVFADLVLYQLFDRGHVKSLDDDITMYCPNFRMQTQYNTTLRQLASQMSGLPREAPCGDTTNQTVFCDATTRQILNNLHSERTLFPPWIRPSYSNLAFALLGHCLVEHLFPGLTYEEYVQKNILFPLNMKDTGFKFTKFIKDRMATGYNPDGSVAALIDLGWIGPAGQMYSTVNDLNKLAGFLMGYVKPVTDVLSPEMRQQMLLPVYINRDQLTGFGTPWEILFESNYTIIIKGGNIGGYSALFAFVPELKVGLHMLFSGAADQFTVARYGFSGLIPALVSALQPHQQPYPYPPNATIYEGVYSIPNVPNVPNVTIETIETRGKQLLARILGFSYYLSYQENLHLQIAFDDNLLPCLTTELLAAKGEWVYFAPVDKSGRSPSFTLPGLYSGITFTRVA